MANWVEIRADILTILTRHHLEITKDFYFKSRQIARHLNYSAYVVGHGLMQLVDEGLLILHNNSASGGYIFKTDFENKETWRRAKSFLFAVKNDSLDEYHDEHRSEVNVDKRVFMK